MVRALLAIVALTGGCGFRITAGTSDASDDATPPGDVRATDAAIDAPEPTAVTFEAMSSGSVSFTSPLVVSHTVGAGSRRLLLVGISTSYAGTTATTVTYGLLPLTRQGVRNAAALDGRVELWSLVDPPAGTADVAIVLSDFNSEVIAGVASISGVDPVAPLSPVASAIGMAGNPVVMIPSAADELVFAVVMFNGSYTTLTPAGGQDARWNTTLTRIVGAGSTRPGITSTAMRWNLGATYDDYWAAAAIAIKP